MNRKQIEAIVQHCRGGWTDVHHFNMLVHDVEKLLQGQQKAEPGKLTVVKGQYAYTVTDDNCVYAVRHTCCSASDRLDDAEIAQGALCERILELQANYDMLKSSSDSDQVYIQQMQRRLDNAEASNGLLIDALNKYKVLDSDLATAKWRNICFAEQGKHKNEQITELTKTVANQKRELKTLNGRLQSLDTILSNNRFDLDNYKQINQELRESLTAALQLRVDNPPEVELHLARTNLNKTTVALGWAMEGLRELRDKHTASSRAEAEQVGALIEKINQQRA